MNGKKNIAKWVDRGINVCFLLLPVSGGLMWCCKVFGGDPRSAFPSDSMEPTLLPGDKILVEKVRHGGAAVRPAGRPGAGGGEDIPCAGLAESSAGTTC